MANDRLPADDEQEQHEPPEDAQEPPSEPSVEEPAEEDKFEGDAGAAPKVTDAQRMGG